MKARLRWELDAVARDRHSGAAELALRACRAVRRWSESRREIAPEECLEIARALADSQPSMAPLARLANEVALAAGLKRSHLHVVLARFEKLLSNAPDRIARQFAAALAGRKNVLVATYSYTSTVLRALVRARGHLGPVLISEARPGLEGRAMARRLAEAGVPVILMTDIVLADRLDNVEALVTGADAVVEGGFVNKVGTGVLARAATAAKKPVWVLADSTKFVPRSLARNLRVAHSGDSLWRCHSRAIKTINPLFEPVIWGKTTRVLTERGWMKPSDLRLLLKTIPVAQEFAAGDNPAKPGLTGAR